MGLLDPSRYFLDFASLNFPLLNLFGYTGLLTGPLKDQNVGTFHSRASLLDIICMAASQLSPFTGRPCSDHAIENQALLSHSLRPALFLSTAFTSIHHTL